MKIVHIAPNAPYNENWGYQENLLPRYQRQLGHEVTLLITTQMHQEGRIVETDCCDKVLKDGVRLIRVKRKKYINRILTGLNARLKIFNLLRNIRPDFIFFHGLISSTIFEVLKYKKKVNPNCKIVCDSHLDKNNSSLHLHRFKSRFFRAVHYHRNKKAMRYIDKIYGVTPSRKKYAQELFDIPLDKIDVLIMGADDVRLDLDHKQEIRNYIREKYNITEKDFLIVTGGKIDAEKNITLLMKASFGIQKVKVLIFGDVQASIKEEFENLLKSNSNLIYIGWIDSEKVYQYFLAADLAFFPGGHSVLWEQACAAKIPCVFKYWEGIEHLNNGGNSDFLMESKEESIRQKIIELLFSEKYYEMKAIAQSEKTDMYLYSDIAKKSLEVAKWPLDS